MSIKVFSENKRAILLFTVCLILFNCTINKSSNDYSFSQIRKEIIKNSSWILVKTLDKYNYDSIPIKDIYGKKIIKFEDKIYHEYYGTNSKSLITKFRYELDSNRLVLKSKQHKEVKLIYEFIADTLVLSRQGRHGTVKDFYIKTDKPR